MNRLVWIGLLLLIALPSGWSDIDRTFLPERPSATLALAQAKATRENKAVFLILYDDRETVANTLKYFFDTPRVRQQFTANFEVCVRDRRKKDVASYDDPTHAWNRARFVVLTPSGERIHEGRFLRNNEAGVHEIEEAVQKWLAVKKTPHTEATPRKNASPFR